MNDFSYSHIYRYLFGTITPREAVYVPVKTDIDFTPKATQIEALLCSHHLSPDLDQTSLPPPLPTNTHKINCKYNSNYFKRYTKYKPETEEKKKGERKKETPKPRQQKHITSVPGPPASPRGKTPIIPFPSLLSLVQLQPDPEPEHFCTHPPPHYRIRLFEPNSNK